MTLSELFELLVPRLRGLEYIRSPSACFRKPGKGKTQSLRHRVFQSTPRSYSTCRDTELRCVWCVQRHVALCVVAKYAQRNSFLVSKNKPTPRKSLRRACGGRIWDLDCHPWMEGSNRGYCTPTFIGVSLTSLTKLSLVQKVEWENHRRESIYPTTSSVDTTTFFSEVDSDRELSRCYRETYWSQVTTGVYILLWLALRRRSSQSTNRPQDTASATTNNTPQPPTTVEKKSTSATTKLIHYQHCHNAFQPTFNCFD
jgi:hypothetical protein